MHDVLDTLGIDEASTPSLDFYTGFTEAPGDTPPRADDLNWGAFIVYPDEMSVVCEFLGLQESDDLAFPPVGAARVADANMMEPARLDVPPAIAPGLPAEPIAVHHAGQQVLGGLPEAAPGQSAARDDVDDDMGKEEDDDMDKEEPVPKMGEHATQLGSAPRGENVLLGGILGYSQSPEPEESEEE